MKAVLLTLLLAVSPIVAAEPAMIFDGSEVFVRLTQAPCDAPEIAEAFKNQLKLEVFAGTAYLKPANGATFKLCWALHEGHVDVLDEHDVSGRIELEELKPESGI